MGADVEFHCIWECPAKNQTTDQVMPDDVDKADRIFKWAAADHEHQMLIEALGAADRARFTLRLRRLPEC